MAKNNSLPDFVKDVADALRAKKGTTAKINPQNFSSEIASIETDTEPNLQNKTVNPTTSQQSVTADSGYDGLNSVTVTAVTSSIDANISAGNIKEGISILGVTGTLQEGITPEGTLEITENGDYDVSNYAWASVNVKNTAKAILGKWNITSGYYLEFDTNGTAKFGAGTQTSSGTYTVNDVTISVNIAEAGVVGDFVYNEDTDTITGTIFEEQFVLTRLVNIREKDVIGKWKKPDGTILFELKSNGVGIYQSILDFTYVIIGNTVSIALDTQTFVVLYDESSDTLTSSIDGVTLTRVQETSGLPIEATTDTEMTNALVEDNLGKVYKFTGTSDTYDNNAIYIIEEI